MVRSVIVVAIAAAIGLAAWTQAWARGAAGSEGAAAAAVLKSSTGKTVGKVALQDTPNGVLLSVDLDGLPSGVHAFHIHEHGRCDPPSFETAGGHFAPQGQKHGFLDAMGPHAGDLPNIHVPDSGRLSVEILATDVTLGRGEASLVDSDGAAFVVHRGADDYQTEPAGDAGSRIACGVIRSASAEATADESADER